MSDTPNILLVEPDERLACLVSRYLERHGINSTIVRQGSQLQPGLLLVSYACVVVNAEIWTCTNIRALCEQARVPVLAFDVRAGGDLEARLDLRSLVAKIRDVSVLARPFD